MASSSIGYVAGLVFALALPRPPGTDSPQLPAPLELRIPEYPEAALKARMSGTVEVEEIVSNDGAVVAASVLSGGPPLLTAAALRAAREWRFSGSPGMEKRKYIIRFEFGIDTDASQATDRCFFGPASASVVLPLQTVRIRGWLHPASLTVTG